jgi:hypothetical protein
VKKKIIIIFSLLVLVIGVIAAIFIPVSMYRPWSSCPIETKRYSLAKGGLDDFRSARDMDLMKKTERDKYIEELKNKGLPIPEMGCRGVPTQKLYII